MMANVSGQAGELVVVMQPEYWEGDAGSVTRKLLAQTVPALPQPEPMFSITAIPHEGFGDIFKTTRSLLIVHISSPKETKSGILFKDNVNAYLQRTVTITAKDQAEYIELFNQNADKILRYFLEGERNMLMSSYSQYFEAQVSERTKSKFNIDICVPPGFKVDLDTTDFLWIRYETPELSQGLLIYTFPYTSDSTFSSEYLAAKRNIFTHNYVPASVPNSYMAIENRVPLTCKTLKLNGNYTFEMRGLWQTENDYMGGPFINLATLDMLNNRVVVFDGFVYAPSKDKRNFIRQMEAMVYSAKFTNQEEIDKVNAQYNLSN